MLGALLIATPVASAALSPNAAQTEKFQDFAIRLNACNDESGWPAIYETIFDTDRPFSIDKRPNTGSQPVCD